MTNWVLPGETPTESQIIAANNFAIASFAQTIGADIMDLGIARDDMTEISTTIEKAVARRSRLPSSPLAACQSEITIWCRTP